ncbi:MAG: diguanylate cyclase response regulator [Leptolyngbya sp. ERB_1_1]
MSETMPAFHNPPLILVVDDDKTMRLGVREAIEQDGYQVIEANDGESCLKTFQQVRPDVVLLDAVMPTIDGFTCCRRIQEISGLRRTPVLMMTRSEDQDSVDQAFAVGAIDYVTKPIHWGVLRQRVKRLIQQVRLYQQLETANHELQRLAAIDELTQIANRRRFDEYLRQEWQRMLREQSPLSLILCDVDFFKHYNNIYGHQAGDDCLRQVAQVIQNSAKRAIDLPARYGDKEFAIVLPNTDQEGALLVAQEIQIGVKQLKIAHAASKVCDTVTVSLGVSNTIPSVITSPELLISAANQALCQAKVEGRDRYCLCLS